MIRAILGIILIAYGSAFGVSHNTRAQAPAIRWQKCLGGSGDDRALSMIKTADSGFAVAGITWSNDGDVSGYHGMDDGWVVKLSSAGVLQWQKCLGGSEGAILQAIVQTADGGYIVAGQTESNDGDVSGNHGGYSDAWVVKLDHTGAIQWQKCLGGIDQDWAAAIIQTADGGYVMAGGTNTNNNSGDVSGFRGGGGDAWVVKLSSAGALLWQKCLGGTGNEAANSILQTADGGYVVAGVTSSNDGEVSGNHGQEDAWVVKLNDTGAIQWQKCLGGSGDDLAASVIQTSDGGFAIAGYTTSEDGQVSGNHGGVDDWIVKLTANGSIQWQKCLGGREYDNANSIIQTSDGGFAVAGITESNDSEVSGNHGGTNDGWAVKLNDTGAIQWQKCLGGTGDDNSYSIVQAANGDFAVASFTKSNDGNVLGNHGNYDAWVVDLVPPPPPPTVAYITPDAGAPGMCVAVEIVAPIGSTTEFGPDEIVLPPDTIVKLVNQSDLALVKLGPSIVSWNGRVIQQMIFIEPNITKLDTSVQLEVVVGGQTSAPFTFHIMKPRHIGTLTGGGFFGQNFITARNTMVVDSLIFMSGTYKFPTTDPDFSTPGNQGFLPARILSSGPIRFVNASFSVDGQNGTTNGSGGAGGAGGGGGGSGYPGSGGAGYSGGGGDNDGSNGPGGTGAGSVTGSSAWHGGSGLSGVTGANGEQHNSSGQDDGGGGGTGHPFGSSGTNGGANNSPAGGHGGGSGGGSSSGYTSDYGGGGGGFATNGSAGQGSGDNSGQAVGNSMLVPLAGGSGGGAGNVTYSSFFGGGSAGGSGGGGGGAIELTSFADFGLTGGAITSRGGVGSNAVPKTLQAAAGGGGGAGGAIAVSARDSVVISTTGSFSVAGGSGGSSSNSNSNGGTGGSGRVRVNGYVSVLSGDPSSANYYTVGKDHAGPSIERVVTAKNSITVFGHSSYWKGEPTNPVTLNIYYEWSASGWQTMIPATAASDPASQTSKWSVNIVPSPNPADTELYIVAVQPENLVSGTFLDVPDFLMSHTSGIITKIPGVPKALVKIDTINFGNITVGKCSNDTTFEVYSIGGADLNITSLVLTGPGAAQYKVITLPPLDVKPIDSAAITLQFCPTAKACPISATLTVNNNDTLKIVQLIGCGIQPEALIHPLNIDFGRVHIGDCKDTTVMLVNPGDDVLTLTKEDLVDPTYFTVLDVTPLTIPAGDSIPLHLRFCPKDTSILSTIDSVISDALQSPILVTLIGSGKIGILSIPPVLDFGLVHKGACKDSGFFAVNLGNDSLLVTSNQISAPNFTLLSPSTPFVLNANDSVFVSMKFCSPDTGSFSAIDTLVSDIPSGPSILLLAHTGIGILSIPNVIDFGSVPTGGCKDSLVAISNIGTDTLVLIPGNTFAAPFSYQGLSPLRLAPGEQTTIDLQFCPTDTNVASENVLFDTVGPGVSPKFTLLGKGIEGVLATSGAIDLGCIDSSTLWSVTLRNTGSAPLTNLTPTILPNGAATIVHQPPATFASGASDSVVLIVVASSIGSINATLSMSWTGGGPITLPITAQVSVPPKITSLDTAIAFDTIGVGDSSVVACVTITNYSCIGISVDSVLIASGLAGEFEIVSNSADKSLSDSALATICIRYKPLRGGPSLGQLLVKSGSDTVQVATLTGNGKGTSVGIRLAVDTIAGRPGDIVDVPVRTLNDVTSAAITSLTFRVTFDPMQLDLKAPVSPLSVTQPYGGNVKDIVPAPNPISATYSVKKNSIGDQEITATYSQPLTGMPIVAELPFEILLPTANTASVHLMSATFGLSLATLSSTNDGLIEIEQCDTDERIALQVNPVDIAPVKPNPFSDRAQVAVQINTAGHIRMEVFNALGVLMMTNFDADVPTGAFAIDIDATGFPSGAYRCVTTWTGTGQTVRDEKMVVVMR